MSEVQARFYISGYQRQSYNPDATEVTLRAVSRGEHNKAWAAATPNGEVKMTILNGSAASWFVDKLGKEVAIVFAEVPPGD
jgi:hypothetical protein